VGAAEALGGAGKDGFGRTVGIGAHVTVPKSENSPALISQPLVASCIAGGVGVLAAVDFNH
jgi:hypothetical protein